MRYQRSTALVATAFLSVACTHETAIVKVGPPIDISTPKVLTPVEGIPFYKKRVVCNRDSIWLEPRYTLTFVIAVDDRRPISHALIFSQSGADKLPVKQLIARITGLLDTYAATSITSQACPAAIGEEWKEIASDTSVQPLPGSDQPPVDLDAAKIEREQLKGNFLLAANTAQLGTAIDYAHQYYLNSKSPWIGSAQVDAKLAADGTLSEGSAQREDDTWSTIFGTVTGLVGDFTGVGAAATPAVTPPTSVSAKVYPSACPASDGWPAPLKVVKYSYALKTIVYKHEHKKQSLDLSNGCDTANVTVNDGSFTVTQVEMDDAKTDKDAIAVSGEIKLPKKAGVKGSGKDDTDAKSD
jgi:hypothetical protein